MHAFLKKLTLASCLICTTWTGVCSAEEPEGTPTPTDFTRDVMMPIGIPLLTFYHTMRENIFLNIRTSSDHPLETIGNFFLIPSQYLFAGKSLAWDGENYRVQQTFKYDTLHWLKTTASLIALPFGEALGAACKGLAYLSPKVREEHHKIKEALKNPSAILSQLENYAAKGLPALHCEEFIPCQGHNRPSYLTKKQKIEIQTLKEITQLLDSHNITYWIDCGTCLGAYRYGGIIPWDWDIDISILLDDHDNVKKLLSTLDPEKYQIQDWSSYSKPKSFLKLYVKETKNFIDIYHYQINEQDKTVGYLFTYIDSPFPESWKTTELKCIKPLKYEEMFPLKKASFDGLTVWAPNDVVAFLQSKYGENLDPTMVWDEATKTYLKVEDHPYYH